MEKWEVTALFLFVLGLLKEFKPSEPFFLEYAIDDMGHTDHYMIHSILPIAVYGGLPALLIILFVTDFLRYKPVIVIGTFCSALSWLIVVLAYDRTPFVELRQVVEAVYTSSEVAYFTYMYANVDHSHYMLVTSLSHAAHHTGRFLGSLAGQLLVSQAGMHVMQINYVTLGGVTMAFIASLFLPKTKRAIYFRSRHSVVATLYKMENGHSSPSPSHPKDFLNSKELSLGYRLVNSAKAFHRDMWTAYSNRYILRWSLWWALAMAVYFQVGLYIESLWRHIEHETQQTIYNGAVDAVQALLSALLGMSVAYMKIPWMRMGEFYLTIISFLQGIALILMSQAKNLYVNYVGYIFYQTLFQVMIVVVTAEVAEGVNESSEAFIFGLNTVFALLIQTLLTLGVTSEFGFVLDIRQEFLVYGSLSCALGLVFLGIALQSRRKLFELGRRNTIQQEVDHAHELASRMASITTRNSSIVSIR